MGIIRRAEITQYVEEYIGDFHTNRLAKLNELKFQDILKRKNPYLFRAKNILTAHDFVKSILDAYLSSQEEGIFGVFMEGLAIFICSQVYGGYKSKAIGIDLEFDKDNTHHFVSIKSGPNWANSDQINRMKQNFTTISSAFLEKHPEKQILCVNGCCYGKDNKPQKNGYLKLCGQRFWAFISGRADIYCEIIEPLGYKAKEKNDAFIKAYSRCVNLFTQQFSQDYCADGMIDWHKIIELNSGYMR